MWGPHVIAHLWQLSPPCTSSALAVRWSSKFRETLASPAILRAPISTPRTPPPSPFVSPRICCKATAKSLAELRRVCRHLRPNSTSTVIPATSPSSYPFHLDQMQLPDHLVWYNLSQNNDHVQHPKPSSARGPPVAFLSRIWKQSTMRIKRENLPCRPEPRRGHAVSQKPPELAGDQLPGWDLAADEPLETLGEPPPSLTQLGRWIPIGRPRTFHLTKRYWVIWTVRST
jgi:hypothetical protein